MNKNWNDRADKDLFFTILSVKNIGVISGAEWTTIGNHMRQLGYGFTNEGCRQHFQGLRRAQNKAEANGISNSDNPRKTDPQVNPITRRPGPGRGRPRKQPAAAGAGAPPAPPNTVATPVVPPPPGVLGITPHVAVVPGVGDVSSLSASPGVPEASMLPHIPPPVDASVSPQGDTPVDDELAVDPSLEDAEDDEDHAAKRPRLDDNQDHSLEDAAVLNALAAHNNPAAGDYDADFYAEA
ncbi:hypothetical protein QBC34DRAFT_70913 [Podospora aff. communis PSN243]|uniref:Myb-like domain-containing protein n=1 Tax=Podospora aff. communis PSN243 TaxID=3040156 RepID=A0AAV9H6N0_9PEZI|nr:hypothetical protein QBC34DRAFT_70913 [Podospora aff. communis PSN243]